ncbi:MAG TPA: MerR family transcriptional regulator [Kofleriaceae bacterium]|jgi:DNA-binding transcriptional MerR regulator
MTGALTIAEAAEHTGITAHTLRYYERIGLMAPISRAHSGHRRYSSDDLRWLELLKRLQASGMPIRRMREFARLHRRGDGTIPQRRAVLDAHREDVESSIAELKKTLALIKKKIALYDADERAAA